ncbi:hypothetical protein BKA80DRAFT_285331 [Phyllosticta citrichinensis]
MSVAVFCFSRHVLLTLDTTGQSDCPSPLLFFSNPVSAACQGLSKIPLAGLVLSKHGGCQWPRSRFEDPKSDCSLCLAHVHPKSPLHLLCSHSMAF